MDATEHGYLLGGRYRLSSVIGHGGMGTVWRAHDEALNRDVAVKELTWPIFLSEEERQTARRRALREAQVAARLRHVNVVSIYDVVEEDGRPWIVMELLPYRSLRDVLAEDGPLSPEQAAQLGLGILNALGAAHAQGVLHRDVKPANILVGPGGRAVLTDFGIARAADSPTLTTAGVLLGSPSYIAPERARGGPAGTEADLWGLGASLYTAVEGRPPFDGNDALAILTAVVADEPDPPGHAGPLWPVIDGLLRKDPDRRLRPAEVEAMLRRVVTPAGPWRRPRRPRRALLLTVAVAVAALATTATAAVVALTGSPGHQAASPPSAPSARSSSAPSSAPSPSTRPTPSPDPNPPSSSAVPPGPSVTSPASSPAAPSGPPAGSSGTGPGGVPTGWDRFTNSPGFSIGVPQGWPVSHVGHYVYVTDPANASVYLLIDQSDAPKPDPLADWEQQQANRAGSYPGYHLIRLESVSYPQAEKAADWEFSYDRDGTVVHILNRNILANAHHAYALYWSTPQAEWAADYHYFQAFAATFRPAAP